MMFLRHPELKRACITTYGILNKIALLQPTEGHSPNQVGSVVPLKRVPALISSP